MTFCRGYQKTVPLLSFEIVPQNMNAIVKTGIQESIVKQIGMIAGRTLATMEEHALTKWPILIALVLLDLEVSCKINNHSFKFCHSFGWYHQRYLYIL